jgi:hypothetical protein
MAAKLRRWRVALVLLLGLLPAPALAGPYFGDWGWCWHEGRDCPRSAYCFLHYWAPELYKARACLCPSNLDQYPPGPALPAPPHVDINRSRCRSIPPAPTAPYADPEAYYGRPVAPP